MKGKEEDKMDRSVPVKQSYCGTVNFLSVLQLINGLQSFRFSYSSYTNSHIELLDLFI